jgi:hypothetical protein
VRTGFYDRFLLLNFEDAISGKVQFGSLLLELSADGTVLQGTEVGVGYTTKRVGTAEVMLRKKKS